MPVTRNEQEGWSPLCCHRDAEFVLVFCVYRSQIHNIDVNVTLMAQGLNPAHKIMFVGPQDDFLDIF